MNIIPTTNIATSLIGANLHDYGLDYTVLSLLPLIFEEAGLNDVLIPMNADTVTIYVDGGCTDIDCQCEHIKEGLAFNASHPVLDILKENGIDAIVLERGAMADENALYKFRGWTITVCESLSLGETLAKANKNRVLS